MGGAAARTIITVLKQLQQHHMYTETEKPAIRAPPLPPTSRTDENPAVSAAGGLVLAETQSLLHVG